MDAELSNPCIVCDGTDHWGARWKVGKVKMIACQQDDPEGFKRFFKWAEPSLPQQPEGA